MSRFVAHMGGWGDKPWASASEVMEVAAIMTKSRGLCIVFASYSVALQVLNALHQLAGQTDRGHNGTGDCEQNRDRDHERGCSRRSPARTSIVVTSWLLCPCQRNPEGSQLACGSWDIAQLAPLSSHASAPDRCFIARKDWLIIDFVVISLYGSTL